MGAAGLGAALLVRGGVVDVFGVLMGAFGHAFLGLCLTDRVARLGRLQIFGFGRGVLGALVRE
ncbi:MAG: hypothetical protein JO240_17860 [Solirubrobacterales bacterium]|nr:hypothetical protein [Solirubrobacterales bacterium]